MKINQKKKGKKAAEEIRKLRQAAKAREEQRLQSENRAADAEKKYGEREANISHLTGLVDNQFEKISILEKRISQLETFIMEKEAEITALKAKLYDQALEKTIQIGS